MNNQENDHLTDNLQNSIESVCQRIDGIEKSIDRLIENLSKIVLHMKECAATESAPDQASD